MTAWFELVFQAAWAGDARVAIVQGGGQVVATGVKAVSGSAVVTGAGSVVVQVVGQTPVEPPPPPPSWGGFTTIGADEILPASRPRQRKRQIEHIFPGSFKVIKTVEVVTPARAIARQTTQAEFAARAEVVESIEHSFAASYAASDALWLELRDEESLIALLLVGELD